MHDAVPVRIPCSAGRAEAVNRAFLSWFWGFGAIFAVAAFWRPALIPFAVGFPIYLVAWRRQVRRAERVLVVSNDRLVLESARRSQSVSRASTGAARFRRRGYGRGLWSELHVVDKRGRVIFREVVGEPERNQIAGALRSRGWPIENDRAPSPRHHSRSSRSR